MDKVKMHSLNNADENYRKLVELFPNAVTEKIDSATGETVRAIDVDVLKQEISVQVVEGREERYQFTWPDKKKAMLVANAPIAATLRPVREESVGKDGTAGGWDSQNLYIEGDNLDVLKLLQETYLGKVKIIYIDPPYNTGNDFVYEDDFAEDASDYLARSGQYDDQGNRLEQNTESNGRFHTDWLNMIFPRIKIAKTLLSENGLLLMSIGQDEIENAIKICDEVFGEYNHIGTVSRVMKSGGGKGQFFSPNIDYVLVYARNKNMVDKFRVPTSEKTIRTYYKNIETEGERKGQRYGEERIYIAGLAARPNQRYWIECPDGSFVIPPDGLYPEVIKEGEKVIPRDGDGCWKWTYETYISQKEKGNIVFKKTTTSALVDENGNQSKYNLYNKVWLSDKDGSVPGDIITEFENRQSASELKELDIPFDFAKPVSLISYLLKIINTDNAIILDFFSGSATTAHSVMELNSSDGGQRRFIMIQLPECIDTNSEAFKAGFTNICEIGKERIRRAGRMLKEKEDLTTSDIDIGFRVFKLDSSNMEDVFYNPSELSRDLLGRTVDNIKIDRSAEDLLFQVMLDLGIDLSSTIEDRVIAEKKIYIVKPLGIDKAYLVACFDKGVSENVVTEIAKMQPYYAVFRDSGMDSDSVATNFDQIFETYAALTVRKVL